MHTIRIKQITLLAIAFFISINAYSQILNPVKWSYAAKSVSSTEAIVLIKATIDKGWHIYSQNPGEGPAKTSFLFNPSKSYSLTGKTIEPKPITKFEKAFDGNVKYFENSVVFQQKIKLKTPQTIVKGKLEFMVCNDSKCLPPEEIEFSIPVKTAAK